MTRPIADSQPFRQALAGAPDALRKTLADLHDERFRGVVDDAAVEQLARVTGWTIESVMALLLPFAAAYATPPVSNFHVGAVSRGRSTGRLYYGANLEFAGQPLASTVHAEQSSVSNAWMHDEEGIDLIAVTAAPCGHCRQFLNELTGGAGIRISAGHGAVTLDSLLPASFGPADLEITSALMARSTQPLQADVTDPLAEAALKAAKKSYAPYSKAFGGVAIRMKDGAVFAGSYAENAAFNPSLPPLQVALSLANLAGRRFDSIEEAVLVETPPSLHGNATRTLLTSLGSAALRVFAARNG